MDNLMSFRIAMPLPHTIGATNDSDIVLFVFIAYAVEEVYGTQAAKIACSGDNLKFYNCQSICLEYF